MSDLPPFRYRQAETRVFAGDGALGHLAGEAARAGARRLLVVCGRSVANRTDLLDRVRAILGERVAAVFDRVEARSPLPVVLGGVAMARETGADGIVAIGGGSAVVTARGIAILLAEAGDPRALATQYPAGGLPVSPRLDAPKVPIFLVLTTPTTAMARAGSALLDPEREHRLELFDPKTRAAAMFWDTNALLTAPPSLTMSAAVSAYAGIVTGLATVRPNPLADSDRRGALDLLTEGLPRLAGSPDDGALRVCLAAAAYLSNRASDVDARGGAGFGVMGAIAHAVDTRYESCGHGEAYAIALPAALRFNLESTRAEQARLATLLGAGDTPEAAAAAVASFLGGLGMPSRLREVGVPEGELGRIAEDAMEDFALRGNARPAGEPGDLLPLLREAW